jgi:hypothetical protein
MEAVVSASLSEKNRNRATLSSLLGRHGSKHTLRSSRWHPGVIKSLKQQGGGQ